MPLKKTAWCTLCHPSTKNLSSSTRLAVVVGAAGGRATIIPADMVRPGAAVIDVGINETPGGGIVGDVDFASAKEGASLITPTPGGVGPLTNILLLKQWVQAAWREIDSKSRSFGRESYS